MLTKEKLEQDKAVLEKQAEMLAAELNGVFGMIRYIDSKLAELAQGDREKQK